jgi:DNA-binding MarR family transcriptional regulator
MTDFKKIRSKSYSFRVAHLFKINACQLDRQLSKLDLCHGQVPYIAAIVEKDGQTQDELAGLILVHRAATARTLKNMEATGLVTRKVNPKNRRQKLVYATDKSRALVDDMLKILDAHNQTMFAGFSEEEKTMTLKLMDHAINNVQAVLDNPETDNDLG